MTTNGKSPFDTVAALVRWDNEFQVRVIVTFKMAHAGDITTPIGKMLATESGSRDFIIDHTSHAIRALLRSLPGFESDILISQCLAQVEMFEHGLTALGLDGEVEVARLRLEAALCGDEVDADDVILAVYCYGKPYVFTLLDVDTKPELLFLRNCNAEDSERFYMETIAVLRARLESAYSHNAIIGDACLDVIPLLIAGVSWLGRGRFNEEVAPLLMQLEALDLALGKAHVDGDQ